MVKRSQCRSLWFLLLLFLFLLLLFLTQMLRYAYVQHLVRSKTHRRVFGIVVNCPLVSSCCCCCCCCWHKSKSFSQFQTFRSLCLKRFLDTMKWNESRKTGISRLESLAVGKACYARLIYIYIPSYSRLNKRAPLLALGSHEHQEGGFLISASAVPHCWNAALQKKKKKLPMIARPPIKRPCPKWQGHKERWNERVIQIP